MSVKIDLKQVMRAYSGKIGCMCGCNGNYWTAKKHRVEAGKERGYAVRTEEVSDRMVKRLVTTIQSLIEKGQGEIHITNYYVSVKTDTRMYAAYFVARK